MTTVTDGVASVTCTCRPDGEALCLATDVFHGPDRIAALTAARVAGWGIRDDGAARCPGCAAKKVMFPRPNGRKPGKASWC